MIRGHSPTRAKPLLRRFASQLVARALHSGELGLVLRQELDRIAQGGFFFVWVLDVEVVGAFFDLIERDAPRVLAVKAPAKYSACEFPAQKTAFYS